MTIQQLRARIKELAAGRYCSTTVEIDDHDTGRTEITYRAYIDGGYSVTAATPEACVAELERLLCVPRQGVEQLVASLSI